MDVLEALIRDTLAEHADDAPPATYLLETVTGRRHPRTRWLMLGAAAAVVLLVIGVAVAAGRGERSVPAGSSSTMSTGPDLARLPDKTVAYHGVVIAVPGELPVLTNACGEPASFVLADDPNTSVSCARPNVTAARQVLTVLLTDQAAAIPGPSQGRAQQSVSVSGTDVMVTVTAPSNATVRRILASVKVAPDPNGCPARLTAPSRRWVVGRTGIQLVRCVYASGGWLQASFRLGFADLVARRIAALPMNVNEGSLNGYEHDLLRFSYPDGTTRIVSVELGSPSLFAADRGVVHDVGNRVANLIRRLSK